MQVAEIMTRHTEVVPSNLLLKEAAQKMQQLDVGKMQQLDVGTLPIRDGDRLIGILTDRDITIRATAQGRDPDSTRRER